MGRVGTEGNVTLREFSEAGFVEDLRTARGRHRGRRLTVLSEAVSLGVPVLSVPIQQQSSRSSTHATSPTSGTERGPRPSTVT
jgi:hypothetical protein